MTTMKKNKACLSSISAQPFAYAVFGLDESGQQLASISHNEMWLE